MPTRQKVLLFLFLAVIFLFLPKKILAENFLSNSGFEDGTSFWSKYGGSIEIISDYVHSGTEAARLVSTTDSTKWIYQVVPITGGTAYLFSGYLIKNSPSISSALLRIAWYSSSDGGGSELSHADSTTSLTGDDSAYRFLTTGAVIAPDDANSARAKAVAAFTSAVQTFAYFDDFTFEKTELPTPIPTSTSTSTPEPPEPTSTPAPTATPKPPTSTPTLKPTLKPTATATGSGEILGQESSPAAFYPWEATEEAKSASQSSPSSSNRLLPAVLLVAGFILLFSAAFWLWYTQLRK